jgi:hypothetical protein
MPFYKKTTINQIKNNITNYMQIINIAFSFSLVLFSGTCDDRLAIKDKDKQKNSSIGGPYQEGTASDNETPLVENQTNHDDNPIKYRKARRRRTKIRSSSRRLFNNNKETSDAGEIIEETTLKLITPIANLENCDFTVLSTKISKEDLENTTTKASKIEIKFKKDSIKAILKAWENEDYITHLNFADSFDFGLIDQWKLDNIICLNNNRGSLFLQSSWNPSCGPLSEEYVSEYEKNLKITTKYLTQIFSTDESAFDLFSLAGLVDGNGKLLSGADIQSKFNYNGIEKPFWDLAKAYARNDKIEKIFSKYGITDLGREEAIKKIYCIVSSGLEMFNKIL